MKRVFLGLLLALLVIPPSIGATLQDSPAGQLEGTSDYRVPQLTFEELETALQRAEAAWLETSRTNLLVEKKFQDYSKAASFSPEDETIGGTVIATNATLSGTSALVSTGAKTGLVEVAISCVAGTSSANLCRQGTRGKWRVTKTITPFGIRLFVIGYSAKEG